MTIRHDSQSASGNGASIGSVKRPRKERTNSTNSTIDESSQAPAGGEESTDGQKPKLKRSSMAARNDPQGSAARSDAAERDIVSDQAFIETIGQIMQGVCESTMQGLLSLTPSSSISRMLQWNQDLSNSHRPLQSQPDRKSHRALLPQPLQPLFPRLPTTAPVDATLAHRLQQSFSLRI